VRDLFDTLRTIAVRGGCTVEVRSVNGGEVHLVLTRGPQRVEVRSDSSLGLLSEGAREASRLAMNGGDIAAAGKLVNLANTLEREAES